MKLIFTISFSLLLATSLCAQPTIDWRRGFGFNTEFNDVKELPDGGYICAGIRTQSNNRSVYVMRTNATGNSLWDRSYGGASVEEASAILPAADGGFYVAGSTSSYGAGGKDFWLLKLSATGDSLWSHTYGGATTDQCQYAALTADGGLMLAGSTNSQGAGSYDLWLVKTDSAGTLLWSRSYGGSASDICVAARVTPDGGYALAANSSSFGNGAFWLLRANANGDSLWSRSFAFQYYPSCTSIALTSDGGYVLAGCGAIPGTGEGLCFVMVKASADGDSLWSRQFTRPAFAEKCNSIQQTVDNGLVLMGTATCTECQPNGWIVKTNAQGDSLWSREFCMYICQSSPTMMRIVRQTADHGFILGGYSSTDIQFHNACLIKFAPDLFPEVVVSPDSLVFGDVWVNQAATDSFQIFNFSGITLFVDSISSSADTVFPSILAPFSIPNQSPSWVRYSVTVPETLDYHAVLTVHSNAADVTLPVSAHGIWTELKAEPAFIDFGEVAVSDTVDTVITLQNAGNTLLQIQSITLAGQDFMLPQPPADTMDAYASYPLMIRYICHSMDAVADTLIIAHTAGPALHIPLSAGIVNSSNAPGSLPLDFGLGQNFPNPFNPSTHIAFDLPRRSFVTLDVVDVLGRHTATLLSQTVNPGHHTVQWSCAACASGLYFIRMQSEGRTFTRKMLFIR